MHNHLVDLDLSEVDDVPPPSLDLEVVLPVHPVVFKELLRIGGDAEPEDDDVELPQHCPTAAGPSSILEHLMPLSVILEHMSPDFGGNYCHLEEAKVAASLLEGLSSKLEIFKGLCSSGDISVEQHAKIDHLSSKSTWHVDPANHILSTLAHPPDSRLGVVHMLEGHVDVARPVLHLLDLLLREPVEGKEGCQLGGLGIEDGRLWVSLLEHGDLLILQVDSKRHHRGAAPVHVEPKDAGHGLVGGDDAVVDVLLHLVGRLVVHLSYIQSLPNMKQSLPNVVCHSNKFLT